MCNQNCSACACKSLFTEIMTKLMNDGVPAGSAAMAAYKEVIETELDLGTESFLETLDRYEFERE